MSIDNKNDILDFIDLKNQRVGNALETEKGEVKAHFTAFMWGEMSKSFADTIKQYAILHGVDVEEHGFSKCGELFDFAKARNYCGWMLEDCKNQILLWGPTKASVIKTAIHFDPKKNIPFFTPCDNCEYLRDQTGKLKKCIWGSDPENALSCWEPGGLWDISNPFPGWEYSEINGTLTEANSISEYLKAAENELEHACILLDLSDENQLLYYAECFDDYTGNSSLVHASHPAGRKVGRLEKPSNDNINNDVVFQHEEASEARTRHIKREAK